MSGYRHEINTKRLKQRKDEEYKSNKRSERNRREREGVNNSWWSISITQQTHHTFLLDCLWRNSLNFFLSYSIDSCCNWGRMSSIWKLAQSSSINSSTSIIPLFPDKMKGSPIRTRLLAHPALALVCVYVSVDQQRKNTKKMRGRMWRTK